MFSFGSRNSSQKNKRKNLKFVLKNHSFFKMKFQKIVFSPKFI